MSLSASAHSPKDLVSLSCKGHYNGNGLSLDGSYDYPSRAAQPGEIRGDWFDGGAEVSETQVTLDYVIETSTAYTIGGNNPYAKQNNEPANGEALQISKADGSAIFCPYRGNAFPGACAEPFGAGKCVVVWK